MPRRFLGALVALAFLASARSVAALDDCRLMRMPDIQGDKIVFVYAGDLWTVPRTGGVAQRLTSSDGQELFPKFSPDGKTIAFTGQYDGNVDAYTIPTEGGAPKRLTFHPADDQVAEWWPDGKSILIRSGRASSIQRYSRFFRIPADGGFEDMLPLPTAGYASLSDDARKIAYVSPSYDNRTWKRYRGGDAPNIWVYDFAANTSENITKDWEGPDEWPMFHGHTVYYCSDRNGKTANIWAYDLDTKQQRQVTKFTDYDVKWPSIGSDAIVFENGGWLYVLDLPGEAMHRISVLVPDDKPATRAELRPVSDWMGGFDLSPSGKRAVIEARGEVFTVPAEKGDVRNLTNSPASRERAPAWSPDGKWVAYLSDASGEYQVTIAAADGLSAPRPVTKTFAKYLYQPLWSPDSKKLLLSDCANDLWWVDAADGKATKIAHDDGGEIHDYAWSPDSRWVGFVRQTEANLRAIDLYSLATGAVTRVSDGMTDDYSPAFDRDGRYLFFISRRTFRPDFGQFELNMQFDVTDKLYAFTLRDSLPSPVAPQSDEETGEPAAAEAGGKGDKGKAEKGAKAEAAPEVRIDLAGIGQRTAELPLPSGRYTGLTAVKGKLVYLSQEAPDENGNAPASVHFYDLEKREDKTCISGVDAGYALSRDGGKLLYKKDGTLGIVDLAEGKKVGDGKLDLSGMVAWVDPPREWMQMFNEAWRMERDMYYDPGMHGLDWNAIGERYRQLVPYVAHRSDLNYILGELIGELSTSHTYVGGGDVPHVPQVNVGLLGVDWKLDAASGLYQFAHIYRDRDWNSPTEAPLGVPGIDVREGDFLLAVDGRPVRSPDNVYQAFIGTAGRQTSIRVGASPRDPKARTFVVKPIGNEASLRYVAWVQANREKVRKATDGRVAYIHVPNTAVGGMQEFSKGYYAQVDKQGIIVDERFNSGGFIPDFFVERLKRTTWSNWASRDGRSFRTPTASIDGPKCILANEYAGSGGDAFPYYFRQQGCGPIIGKRTWGGLVGISRGLPLVDGGAVTIPDFGIYTTDGQWVVENHGVDPDIEVENTPESMVSGHDLQLDRAIQYELEQLKEHPVVRAKKPPYKKE